MDRKNSQWDKGAAGNAGVYITAWHLSRAGFAVAVTSRNMKGPDIVAVAEDGEAYSIQVKAGSLQSQDIPFGLGPITVREPWWVIVTHAMSDTPTLYVLTRDEMQRYLVLDSGVRSGKSDEMRTWWFPATRLCRPGHLDELVHCRDAWQKLNSRDLQSA